MKAISYKWFVVFNLLLAAFCCIGFMFLLPTYLVKYVAGASVLSWVLCIILALFGKIK